MTLVDLTVSTTTDKKSDTNSTRNTKSTSPERWRTTEFYIYYVVVIIVLPIMLWIPISVSSREFLLLSYREIYEAKLDEPASHPN